MVQSGAASGQRQRDRLSVAVPCIAFVGLSTATDTLGDVRANRQSKTRRGPTKPIGHQSRTDRAVQLFDWSRMLFRFDVIGSRAIAAPSRGFPAHLEASSMHALALTLYVSAVD